MKNKSIIPNINGSVGMEIPTPRSKSLRLTDNGVKNTMSRINLSREKNKRIPIKTSRGNKKNQKNSLAINTEFIAMNNAVKR